MPRPAATFWIAAALVALAGASLRASEPKADEPAPGGSAPARVEAEVVLKDGRRATGFLLAQTEEQVILEIAGVATPFPRNELERLRVLPGVVERYKQLRESIDDKDFAGRLQLVDWLRDRREYSLALDEVNGILEADPNNARALEQRRLLGQLRLLERRSGKGDDQKGEETEAQKQRSPAVDKAREAAKSARGFPTLTPEQIRLMKVFEIDLENPPPISIDRDTITKLLKNYAGKDGIPTTPEQREAFYRRRPVEILKTIFDLRARELYTEVKVTDHPASVKRFRDAVNGTWLINSCATTVCHGGEEAGRLRLASRNPNSEATLYTNLFILDRFRLGSGVPLIDYQEPARSPLLQMTLPRHEGVHFQHPDVEIGPGKVRWRNVFQTTSDARFQDAVAWIEAMYKPRPEYPIDYKPPEGRKPGTPASPPDKPEKPANPKR